MYRIIGLAVAAAFLAGCGQIGLPGARAARTVTVVETTYAQVAVAPPPVVIHEVRYEALPPVVNTTTNTTIIEAQPAVDRVVVVREAPRYEGNRPPRPPAIGPILRRLLDEPRGRPNHDGRRHDPPGNNGRNPPNHRPSGQNIKPGVKAGPDVQSLADTH